MDKAQANQDRIRSIIQSMERSIDTARRQRLHTADPRAAASGEDSPVQPGSAARDGFTEPARGEHDAAAHRYSTGSNRGLTAFPRSNRDARSAENILIGRPSGSPTSPSAPPSSSHSTPGSSTQRDTSHPANRNRDDESKPDPRTLKARPKQPRPPASAPPEHHSDDGTLHRRAG